MGRSVVSRVAHGQSLRERGFFAMEEPTVNRRTINRGYRLCYPLGDSADAFAEQRVQSLYPCFVEGGVGVDGLGESSVCIRAWLLPCDLYNRSAIGRVPQTPFLGVCDFPKGSLPAFLGQHGECLAAADPS